MDGMAQLLKLMRAAHWAEIIAVAGIVALMVLEPTF